MPQTVKAVVAMSKGAPVELVDIVDSPAAPANRRISILVLNEHAQHRLEEESLPVGATLSADSQTPTPASVVKAGADKAEVEGQSS